jgi:hypothetical protein
MNKYLTYKNAGSIDINIDRLTTNPKIIFITIPLDKIF